MNNQDFVRAYSIQEVSQLLNIPSGTIRQWEKDLQGLLNIPRTKQGARYYTDKEVDILQTIQQLRLQNVGKGMIRSLLEKHLAKASESNLKTNTDSEVELMITPSIPKESYDVQAIEALYSEVKGLRHDVIQEVKQEIAYQRQIMLDEIKHHLTDCSIQTVSEISKSIQRSNDKRKADVQIITEAIQTNSQATAKTFETIVKTVTTVNDKQQTLLNHLMDDLKEELAVEKEVLMQEVSSSLVDVKNDVRSFAFSLHEDQQQLRAQMLELKEHSKEILNRENGFQELVTTFREAAAAKQDKRSWWKWWS